MPLYGCKFLSFRDTCTEWELGPWELTQTRKYPKNKWDLWSRRPLLGGQNAYDQKSVRTFHECERLLFLFSFFYTVCKLTFIHCCFIICSHSTELASACLDKSVVMLELSFSMLTLWVPSNFEWVASPGPSNIGAKRSKVGLEPEKPNKNVYILTFNIALLPLLSDTISLFSSPVYSESNTHPSFESSTLCSLSSSMKSIYPMLQKLIFLWRDIIFLPIWTLKQCNGRW